MCQIPLLPLIWTAIKQEIELFPSCMWLFFFPKLTEEFKSSYLVARHINGGYSAVGHGWHIGAAAIYGA